MAAISPRLHHYLSIQNRDYLVIYSKQMLFLSMPAQGQETGEPKGESLALAVENQALQVDGKFKSGPVYGKLEVHGCEPPWNYWKQRNTNFSFTPTVELPSLFARGVVKVNGVILNTSSGILDWCIAGRFNNCPHLPEVRIYRELTFAPGELALIPGWYEVYGEFFTTDRNHQKFKIARLEMKIKVMEP